MNDRAKQFAPVTYHKSKIYIQRYKFNCFISWCCDNNYLLTYIINKLKIKLISLLARYTNLDNLFNIHRSRLRRGSLYPNSLDM